MKPEIPPMTIDWRLRKFYLDTLISDLRGGAKEGDGGVGDEGAHGAVDHLADGDDVAVEAVAEDQTHSCPTKGVEERLCRRLGRLDPTGSFNAKRAR